MLIELHQSIIPSSDSTLEEKISFQEALANLILAEKNRHHILLIPPPFFKKIEDIKFFEKLGQDEGLGKNLRLKRGLEIISDKSATRRNLKKKLTHTLLVIDESTTSPKESSGVTATVLRIPLFYCEDLSFLQKTHLLGENYDDTRLYWLMGEVYAYREGLQREVNRKKLKKGFIASANPMSGGGDTTNKVFKHLTTSHLRNEQKQLCLCIADSDVSIKGGLPKKNSTYGKVETQQNKNKENFPLLSHVIHTKGREAENIFSNQQIEKLVIGEKNQSRRKKHENSLNFLKALEENGLVEVRDYLDFKKGLSKKLFLEDQEYWDQSLLTKLCKAVNKTIEGVKESIKNSIGKKIRTEFLPKLKDSLDFFHNLNEEELKEVFNYLAIEEDSEEAQILKKENQEYWKAILKELKERAKDQGKKETALFGGFSELLPLMLEKIEEENINEISETVSLCKHTEKEWDRIGPIVFSWCCAEKRELMF